MFAVYAKDNDEDIGCSHRYQQTEFLGVFSTIELAKQQIENHEYDVYERIREGTYCTPRVWEYYIYSVELDQEVIMKECDVVFKSYT
jgi:hypothetical protein